MSDLARLIAWGAKSIYFMDLEFTLDRDRTMELCERMAGRKMLRPWCCQTRADHVDPELLSKMRAAGCRLIHFGLETASQRLLERIGKGMSPDRADEAVRLCREAGIETAGFFLFGLPGETERDRRSTVNLALGLGLNYASFHVGRPPCPEPAWPGPVPGWTGPVWEEHDIGLLARDVRRALMRFYLRPSFLVHCLRSRGLEKTLERVAVVGSVRPVTLELSVIIPVYNEADILVENLRLLGAFLDRHFGWLRSDRHQQRVHGRYRISGRLPGPAKFAITFLQPPRAGGVGRAFAMGLDLARSEMVVSVDMDLSI